MGSHTCLTPEWRLARLRVLNINIFRDALQKEVVTWLSYRLVRGTMKRPIAPPIKGSIGFHPVSITNGGGLNDAE